MSETIIKVENLCKTFKLYNSPKYRLVEALHPLRRKFHHEYQALENISFEIKKGQSVGILGRNGAGKSTLLKLLTGVLTPTSGTVEVKGRIAALLELGSGFNPELSGIDNIYFQGAILGFLKDEMDAKVKEIIEFADIGEYISQPVKSYSSGMFARLAFSIAISVDPDVLIIDEALSVGDFSFQQKCFRKLKQLKEAGKNIIFVSHDTSAIQAFCDECIYLKLGNLQAYGESSEVINLYYSHQVESENVIQEGNDLTETKVTNFGKGKAKIRDFKAANKNGLSTFVHGEEATLTFIIECLEDLDVAGVGVTVRDKLGRDILFMNNYIYNYQIKDLKKNETVLVSFDFMFPNLSSGRYSLSPAVCEGVFDLHEQQHWIFDAQEITVHSKNPRMGDGIVCVPTTEINIKRIERTK